jgi:hypothetical protein
VTYSGIDELSTPHDEILFFGDMGIGHRLHVIEESGLGFADEGSDDVENWSAIVGDGS